MKQGGIRQKGGTKAGALRGAGSCHFAAGLRCLDLLLLAACCLQGAAASAAAGRSGGYFLRVVQSPRASAMGEGGTGLYGDLLGALALNPAALGRTRYSELAFTYNSWLEGLSLQQAAYARPLENKSVLAGSVSLLQMKSISGYDNSGGYAGSVEAGDMAFGLNYAGRLSGPWNDRRFGLFAGGGLKYARETLDTFSADTLLFDAGLLSVSRFYGGVLGLGVSAQSLGGGFKFNSVRDDAPSVLRAGAAWIITAAGDPLTIAVDVKKPNDDKASCSAGVEYIVKGLISARLGYAGGADLGSGLRFGMGFKLKVVQVDYALAKYGEFGFTHKFGISYKFGEPVDVTPRLSPEQEKARWKLSRGKEFMRDRRYYEAVLEFNDAVVLEPNLKEALQLMKQARDLMETEKPRKR